MELDNQDRCWRRKGKEGAKVCCSEHEQWPVQCNTIHTLSDREYKLGPEW